MESIFNNSGLDHIPEQILGQLDTKSLYQCLSVSKTWNTHSLRIFLPRKLDYLWTKRVVLFHKTALSCGGSKKTLSQLYPQMTNSIQYFMKPRSIHALHVILDFLDFFIGEAERPWSHLGGITPLQFAATMGNIDFLELFFNIGHDFNEVFHGRTVFQSVFRFRQFRGSQAKAIQTANFLLKQDLERINVSYNEPLMNRSPLMLACTTGCYDLVQLFFQEPLSGKIDVNLRDITQKTAFMIPITCHKPKDWLEQRRDSDIIQLFLDQSELRNIELNATDGNGRTALHLACQNGSIEIAKLLIGNQNIDFNAVDHRGKTALHLACENARLEIAKLLIENAHLYGINCIAVDHNGETILHDAVKSYNNDPHPVIYDASIGARAKPLMVKMVLTYLKHNFDHGFVSAFIKRKNSDGETAHKIAEDHGYRKVLKVFQTYHYFPDLHHMKIPELKELREFDSNEPIEETLLSDEDDDEDDDEEYEDDKDEDDYDEEEDDDDNDPIRKNAEKTPLNKFSSIHQDLLKEKRQSTIHVFFKKAK